MSKERDPDFLADILEASKRAQKYISGLDYEERRNRGALFCSQSYKKALEAIIVLSHGKGDIAPLVSYFDIPVDQRPCGRAAIPSHSG